MAAMAGISWLHTVQLHFLSREKKQRCWQVVYGVRTSWVNYSRATNHLPIFSRGFFAAPVANCDFLWKSSPTYCGCFSVCLSTVSPCFLVSIKHNVSHEARHGDVVACCLSCYSSQVTAGLYQHITRPIIYLFSAVSQTVSRSVL